MRNCRKYLDLDQPTDTYFIISRYQKDTVKSHIDIDIYLILVLHNSILHTGLEKYHLWPSGVMFMSKRPSVKRKIDPVCVWWSQLIGLSKNCVSHD